MAWGWRAATLVLGGSFVLWRFYRRCVAGLEEASRFAADVAHAFEDLQAAGFTTLRDEHTTVNQKFVLVGRRDKVENRASAAQVIPKSDLPVIVMDHQPADMDAIANTRADLVVSGHTHRGQVFPATLLIKYFQTYPYGHYRIDDSQLVVTSGYGLWGLPFRLGARSEVAIIELIGK